MILLLFIWFYVIVWDILDESEQDKVISNLSSILWTGPNIYGKTQKEFRQKINAMKFLKYIMKSIFLY